MATDSTNLPQGEATLDAGMTGSDLDLTTVQEAANEPANYVDLPKGNTVILLPVQPGQTLRLPTDSTDGVLAKIGPEGNLALVVDGRTIILQGFLKANDQSPIKIVTSDGDDVNVADLIAATDPSLDIQTAAGPASGDQGDTDGSGIYIPFLAGPGLGGLDALGILDPTALQYRLIDDEYKLFTLDEDDKPDFTITFDILGGIVNEDDLPADDDGQDQFAAAKFVFQEGGNDGKGNDEFDVKDREQGGLDSDGDDSNGNGADPDREPLSTVATVKVDFHGDVPGKLEVDLTKLPASLTSEGEPIVYVVDPANPGVNGNGIFGYVESGANPGYQDGEDRLVFEVRVDKDKSDSEFKVTFTLHDNIDNEAPDFNDDGVPDLLSANEQLLGLPIHFKITDSDGSSVGGTLPIKVEDDKPFFGEVVGVGATMEIIGDLPEDISVTHDETKGAQSDDGADDQSFFDFVPYPPFIEINFPLIAVAADLYDQVINQAGFSLPYGDSVGALLGAAQSQVKVSFGADGATQEHLKDIDDPSARESVFGTVSGTGENERPFELFMIDQNSVNGTVPVEDNKSTVTDEGNLTASPQKTNMTVTWNGEVLPVWLVQIDANTIVGYIEAESGGEQQALVVPGIGAGKEAVLVIDINDAGVLSFFQLHQLNHPDTTNGDEQIQILAEDGETPLIYVRASDFDGDHAIQPVTVGIQDDKPVFCKVDWGCDNDSKHGVGLIDEDKLDPNGNNDWAPGDDKGGKHADGEIIFNFGADKPGHLEVSNLTVKDSAGVVLLNLGLNWASFDPIDGSIDVTGSLNNLKTADGEAITVVATLDPISGLLTIVGNDAGGNPAFTFTLDTSGADIGEFDFCLNQALYHPYTDLDSKNDGPLKAFEDNLKFDFTVVGKDVDGDSATGHIKVNVDDDSPKAECDVDCVTEGKDGETLNSATGNVVTGDGDTIFGNDANNLDGNQDSPGADQPYTISKISHCGADYFLNTPEGGDPFVTKGAPFGEPGSEPLDGTTETFDPVTGILHIPTEKGGTLDIVLISDTQENVGDYKYTVPENAQHEHDIHAGPETLAESVSGAFNTVGEWTSSFANNGITVVALNGNLDIKDINVAGGGSPDYRGIGVENFEGDEIEVDRGGNEGLRLNLANDTNNIALTIGALFDGTQYDNGHQEILEWKIFNNGVEVGSGQILGNNDGVVTLDIDSLVPFDRIELKPINNGQGDTNDNSDFLLINAEICCPEDKFTEKFDYTLRDADGDEACATLKVDVKDTEPSHEDPHSIITTLLVDEDGLPKGVGNTDSPQDNEEDHSGPNASVDDAVHFGTIPFTPGADPTSIELTVLGGPNTGLRTLDNQKILAAWDPTLKALIGYIEGTDPNDAANQVFKMTILDPLTGAYSFELLQAVKHDNTDLFGTFNDTENVLNTPANFVVVAQIEDKDCDVIYSKVIVSIDDDMPVITECHDEQGNDINLLVNGSFEDIGGKGDEDGGKLDRGDNNWGVFSQIPGWKSGNATDPTQAGLEVQADGAVPQIDAKDGEHYVELDSDALNPADSKPGSTNASIYQDVDTVEGNNYVLSFSYSPRVGDPATDGIEVWFDGVKVATIDSGKVGEWTEYTFVVEAGEDPADSTPDSSRLEFKAVGTSDSLGGFIDDVSLTACALVDEDALPNGIEGGPGDDGPIGACFSGSLGVNFGADGGKSIEFATTGQPTLFSHGVQVKYAWDNATKTLIGYTGTNVPANWVFTVAVESLDNGGEYKFTLLKPLDHPDSNNDHADDKTDNGTDSFEDNLVFELKFSATDRDDDKVNGHLKINVDDDSPSGDLVKIEVDKRGDGALVHDETKGDDGDDDVDGPLPQFNGLGLVALGFATTTVNVDLSGGGGNPNAAYGADGPGTTDLSLTGPGGLPFSGTATNLFDTATGEPIFLYTEAGLVVGRVGSAGLADAGGEISFALSIDNAGNLSVAQYRAIQHPDATNPDDSVTLLAAGGEDAVVHITAKVTDYDGDAVTVTVPLDGEECNGAIRFEDDGPTATCDYDCVVEGMNDNVPNSAIGNVVTGANATIFGSDINNLDGNADTPGVDGPYTISKLSHGGTTYYLNDLGGGSFGVTEGAPAPAGTPIDGVTETFDGKTLKIPTDEGGTFEIVMVSPTQAEVGDYKYTVPENAQHEHDIHAGPETLAESVSGAFNTVGEWTSSFANNGITVVALNGNLDIKDINVAGGGSPDYRGIGVENFEGDEIEVDRGGNEGLRLNLANDTNNIALTIGALFDGTQYDNGHQEILGWKIFNNGVEVGSGQILGNNDGVVTLDIDSLVPFDRIELKPINNGQSGDQFNDNSDFLLINAEICCPTEKLQEQFEYTLRDGDGDESTATLKIDVKDTEPSHEDPHSIITALVVDEDGLPNGVGNTDSPNDDDEDYSGSNAGSDDAKHIGTIPFTPGADPVSIELTVLGGPETSLKTLANQKVLAAWDPTLKALIGYIEGTDPNDAANQVFKMTILNPLTGEYSFELLQPVKHDNADIFGAANDTENVLNTPANFIVVAEIEDKDCDVIFSKVLVTIDDDMPVITECYERGNLLVNGSFEDLGKEDDGKLENGSWGVFSQIPGWKSGADEANPSGLPGLEIQNSSAVGLVAKDGKFYVELDSDNLDQSDPAPSTTNASIYQDAATYEGHNYVLSFSYSPRTGDETTDGIEVWFDGVKVATIDSGKVGEWKEYSFVVEAGEGDGTPDASRLEFKAVGSANELGGFIDDVSLTSCAIVDEDALPSGIEGGPGDDGPIGACFSGSLGVNFGADGGKSIVFSESGQPNLTSHGNPVKYFWNDATKTLIGYTGANAGKTDPANWVFTVALESLDNGGEYKFTLLKPLDHPDTDNIPGNENDHGKGSFEDNLVFDLKFKATDRDDDTVEGKLRINVDDDSPSADLVKIEFEPRGDGALVHDETKGDDGNDDVDGPLTQFDGFGLTALGFATTLVNVNLSGGGGNPNAAYGADGPGTTDLSLTDAGGAPFVAAASNLFDTATGEPIFLYTEAGLVVGRVGSAGSADALGEISFALSIDNAGNLSVAQYRAIQHPDATNPDDAVTLLAGDGACAVVHITAKVTDYDGDAITVTTPLDGKEGHGSIKFEDDGPTANADEDSVKESGPTVATGNVLTGADGGLGSDVNTDDGKADNAGTDGLKSFAWTDTVVEAGAVDYIQGTYGKLHVDGNGNYKYELDLTDPDTKALTKGQIGQEVFHYTIEDNDGDKSSTTLKINVEGSNEPPKIDLDPQDPENDDETAVVSDEGLKGGNTDSDPVPTDETNLPTFTGQLVVSDPDLPADTLTVAMQSGAFPAWTFSDNQAVTWTLVNGHLLEGRTPDNLLALTVEITATATPNTYDYTVTLHQPLDHPINSIEDELQFGIQVRVTDSTGEFDEATLTVQVEDDKPKITLVDESLVLGTDETVGGKGDFDDPSAVFPLDGGAFEGDEAAAGGVLAGLGTVIGFDSGNGAALFDYKAGADGEDSHAYGLKVVNGGLTTAVDTETGHAVQLVDVGGGVIEGRTVGSNLLVLAFTINATTGAVEMAQYRAVNHGTDQPASYPDEVTYLNTGNLGVLSVTLEVTDKDGDKETAERDISHSISIDDDGPKADLIKLEVDKGGDGKLVHDETAGVQNGGNGSGATDPDASGQDEDDVASRPAEFAALEGANPLLVPVGYASVAVNIDLSGGGANPNAAYGSDGPGTTTVALTDGAGDAFIGQQSTLFDTATGQAIFLFTEGSLVVGRVGGVGGQIAFALSIDGNSLDVAQYRAIQHPNTGTDDESVTLLGVSTQFSSLVFAKIIVTDDDGDSVSKLVPFDGYEGHPAIVFQDDGPTAVADTDSVQDGSDDLAATGNVVTGKEADNYDPNQSTDDNLDDGKADTLGTDGFGSISWADPTEAGGVDKDGVIQGKYGKLLVDDDGGYRYELDVNDPDTKALNSGQFDTEVFNYTIKDGDGDTASTTLTIKVEGNSSPPTIDFFPNDPNVKNGSAVVSDEGLTGGNKDGTPAGDNTDSAAASGSFVVNDADVGETLTVKLSTDSLPALKFGGVDVVWSVDGPDNHVIHGKTGGTDAITITISKVDNNNYNYSVNLIKPLDHPVANAEDEVNFSVKVTVSDTTGGTDSALLNIQVEDDQPINNDVTISKTVVEDGLPTGNGGGVTTAVFTAAQLATLVSAGADTPLSIKLNSGIDNVDSGLDSKGFNIVYDVISATQVNGVADGRTVFTIIESPAGTFTFTLLDQVDHTPLASGGGDAETISLSLAGVFTATDFDKDSVVINGGATVVIENDIPQNNSATLSGTVFEDGLTGLSTGIGGGATSVQFTNAQLSGLVDVGADEPLTVKLNAGIDNVNTGLDSKGADIFFDYVDATHVNGVADGRTVFTIVESPAGTFTVTLLDQIDHTPLNSGGGDNETISLSLANVFTATDFDGDQIVIDAGASVTINNDVPVANVLTKSIVANAGVDTNLMVILDISGSMDEPSGMEGLDKLQAAIASVKELIEQYDALGQVKVRIVTFSTNASEQGAVWMTVDQARTFLNTLLDNDGLTNYDEALEDAMNAFPDSGKIVGAQNVAYFLSDGNPNQPDGDAGINGTEETAWINFLKANDINSFALGFGEPGDVNQSNIDPIAYNGKTETNTNGQVITDLNLLTATLVSTVTPPVNGNVKTDGGNGIGADEPGIVSQVTFGGNTFVFNGTNSITRTTGSLAFVVSGGGTILTFSTPNGTLQINMSTGAYTYALLADAAANDQFGYTLTDFDGDSATNTLQITASVTDIAPIVRDDIIIAGNDDNSGNESIVVPAAALLWNDSDANGDAITVSGTFTNVSDFSGAGVTLAGGNITMEDKSGGGSFTYTGTANGKSDTGDVVLDRSQEGDNSLDGNGLDNIIVSDSSNNELNGYEGNDVLLGNLGNDTLNGGAGRDWLVGGDGDDLAVGGAGNDLVDVSQGNDTVRYTSALDGKDVISGFDAVGGAGNQDFIDLNQLFDNNGNPNEATRDARINVQVVGSDTVITVDATGDGFGANDVVITVLGVTGLTKGISGEDINYGND